MSFENLDAWLSDLHRDIQTLEHELSAEVRSLALEVVTRFVLRTPVDTGRARGNWQVSFDAPNAGVLEVEDKSGAQAIQAATNVLTQETPFSVIWITNNVDYIEYLEEGSSKIQAPQGMVAVTLAELGLETT